MKVSNKLKIIIVISIIFIISIFVFSKRYLEDYTSDFIDHNIYSKTLGEERKIFIRLPKGYDKKKSYPLIIKSDGNFNLSHWDELMADLPHENKIEDSIIVAIPNLFWIDSRNRDLVPPYARKDVKIEVRPKSDNSATIFGKADLFLNFIELEVIPYIENNYSINNNRVLSGFSAGGSFVLYTIVTKPELFTGYFAFISRAAWYDKSVVVNEFKKGLNKVSGKPLFLYLSLGRGGNEIITGSFKGLLSAIESDVPLNLYSTKYYSYIIGADYVEDPYASVGLALEAYYKFRADKI